MSSKFKAATTQEDTLQLRLEGKCPAVEILLPLINKLLLAQSNVNIINETIDNREFCRRYGISAKTALSYRNKGLRFSQPSGKKIYYEVSWIQDFLHKNSTKAF